MLVCQSSVLELPVIFHYTLLAWVVLSSLVASAPLSVPQQFPEICLWPKPF